MPLLGKKRHAPTPTRAGTRILFSAASGYNGRSVGYKGEEGYDPGPFNRQSESPLVPGAGSGDTPGEYLSPLCDETAKRVRVLVVNFQLLNAELADLFLEKNFAFTTPAVIAVPSVYMAFHAPVVPITIRPIAIHSITIVSGKMLVVFQISFVRHINLC